MLRKAIWDKKNAMNNWHALMISPAAKNLKQMTNSSLSNLLSDSTTGLREDTKTIELSQRDQVTPRCLSRFRDATDASASSFSTWIVLLIKKRTEDQVSSIRMIRVSLFPFDFTLLKNIVQF